MNITEYKYYINMPLIKKIVEIGHSKAIFIPKSWFDYYEQETGQIIEKVAMEINQVLKITPIFKPKKGTTINANKR